MTAHAGPATVHALVALLPILSAAGLDGAEKVVGDACEDVAALSGVIDQQTRDMRTMIIERNDVEREVTRLRREQASVIEALEDMRRISFARIESAAAEKRALDALYLRIVGPIRPMGVVHAESTTEPRRAAGA
jgi:hypothetical protein